MSVRKKTIFIIISGCCLLLIPIIYFLSNPKPIDVTKVKSVHIEVRNLGSYTFTSDIAKSESFQEIVNFENMVMQSKGVNGFANAVTWEINFIYKMEDGQTIERKYKGQEEVNELQLKLKSIDIIKEKLPY